jgi:hypothetical protein
VRVLAWLVRAGVMAPWVWLTSVYAVWLIACVQLGRRPRPLLDDPKHLGGWVDIPHTLSILLFMLAFPLLGAGLGAALWIGIFGRAKWKVALLSFGALLLSWTMAFAVGRLNPGRVIAWYLD